MNIPDSPFNADVLRIQFSTRALASSGLRPKQWGLVNDNNPCIALKRVDGSMIYAPIENTNVLFSAIKLSGLAGVGVRNIVVNADGTITTGPISGNPSKGTNKLNVSDGLGSWNETLMEYRTAEFRFSYGDAKIELDSFRIERNNGNVSHQSAFAFYTHDLNGTQGLLRKDSIEFSFESQQRSIVFKKRAVGEYVFSSSTNIEVPMPVANEDAVPKSYVTGLLSSKADLVGGKVPASQLPSYVDDVLEYPNIASFPVIGESGKIYIALNTNKLYRWGTTLYVEISDTAPVPAHNSLTGLQGGSVGEYYHLTLAEKTTVTNADVTGLVNLSTTGIMVKTADGGGYATRSLTSGNGSITITNPDGVANSPTLATTFEALTSNIKMNGTQNTGSLNTSARGDHIHPIDTSRAPTLHSSSGTTYGVSSTANYGHAKASSSVPLMNGVASVGTMPTVFAQGDHIHPIQKATTPTNSQFLRDDGTWQPSTTDLEWAKMNQLFRGDFIIPVGGYLQLNSLRYRDLVTPIVRDLSSRFEALLYTYNVQIRVEWGYDSKLIVTENNNELTSDLEFFDNTFQFYSDDSGVYLKNISASSQSINFRGTALLYQPETDFRSLYPTIQTPVSPTGLNQYYQTWGKTPVNRRAGLVPPSLGEPTKFLRADGSWEVPSGGSGSSLRSCSCVFQRLTSLVAYADIPISPGDGTAFQSFRWIAPYKMTISSALIHHNASGGGILKFYKNIGQAVINSSTVEEATTIAVGTLTTSEMRGVSAITLNTGDELRVACSDWINCPSIQVFFEEVL